MESHRSTIAVLGAGFGGLHAALDLHKKLKGLGLNQKYRILLIDRNEYHTYAPTLYEAATTSKVDANLCGLRDIVTLPIRQIIAHTRIEFVQALVNRIDIHKGLLTTTAGVIPYSFLIFAPGSEANFFNIKGLQEHALTLKTLADAIKIRERIVAEVEDASRTDLKIVIGGGGSTGVELAGELQKWLCALKKNKPGEQTSWATITIIEGAASILANFPQKVIQKAEKRLKRLGAITIKIAFIKEATENSLKLSDGSTLPFDVLIWTGGVKANRLGEQIAQQLQSKSGKVETNEHMQCISSDTNLELASKIYGIGDAICFIDPKTQRPIPGVARAAIFQATVAAHNVVEEIKMIEKKAKAPDFKVYHPMSYPYVIPVGGKFAIAKLGPFIFSGITGWLFKVIIELNYLISIMKFSQAFKIWLRGIKIFIRNERLG